MIDARDVTQGQGEAMVPTASIADDDSAWYLYGITWRGAGDAPELVALPGVDGDEPVRRVACGDLAAIVRRVSRAEFEPDTLQARLGDAAWLEAAVRGHNQVIAAIHQEQAILPSKFGSVYASIEDLSGALDDVHDALVAQLRSVTGCDEWGIHVYADRPALQRHVVAEAPTMRQLQQEIAAARPGRAYFLQRKLADELAAATEQAMADLASAAYDHLIRWAVAGRVNPQQPPASDGEVGILRADFLVRREAQDAFVAAAGTLVEARQELRCDYSGPWPPYSFAILNERNGDGQRHS